MWSQEADALANRLDQAKYGAYSAFMHRLQQKACSMAARMMDHGRNYQTLVYGLRIVEFFQLVYLLVSSRLAHMWKAAVIQYLEVFCSYLNWPLMPVATQEAALLSLTAVNALIIVAWFFLLGLFLFIERKVFLLRAILLRVMTAYSIVYSSVLLVPMAELSFQVIFCEANDLPTQGNTNND